MQSNSASKPRCAKCKRVKRRGVFYIICENKRHKQKQGTKQRRKAA